jgi:6-phosphofructokinase 1
MHGIQGGTVIGSARCQAFRTPEGRLQAAKNLVLRDINCLVWLDGAHGWFGLTLSYF